MKYFLLVISQIILMQTIAQVATSVTLLNPTFSESSGILYVNQKILTIQDSDNEAAIFEIDTASGNFTRKVVVANASNVDWEDLTMDSNYIYIGDFGNNSGNRTDLKIYKVSLSDYWNTANDTIYADTIRFNFANQNDFTAQPYATNFDCEAMTAIGDSIYLFTKNWVNLKTFVYQVPKNSGNYSIFPSDSLPVQGLITAADFNTFSNQLVLIGNTPFNPFLVTMDWNTNVSMSSMTFHRDVFDAPNSIQVESIATIAESEYYLTAESFSSYSAELLRLNTSNMWLTASEFSEKASLFFPNPAKNIVYFTENESSIKEIYSSEGHLVLHTNNSVIDISDWSRGVYLVKIHGKLESQVFKLILD